MNVFVLGGSAQSLPQLFDFLSGSDFQYPFNFVLVSRSDEKLKAVVRASCILTKKTPIKISFRGTHDLRWKDDLAAADIVLIQPRIGGLSSRAIDTAFPLRYGICGDQDLGPGALSSALRSWPELKLFFKTLHEVAPDVKVLFMSSPLGILVRAIKTMWPKISVFGICELPWTTLGSVCRTLGVARDAIKFEYLGVHHAGWFYQLEVGFKDMLREYIASRQAQIDFPSAKIIKICSAIPTKYLRLHYQHDEVLCEQLACGEKRSQWLAKHSELATKIYKTSGRKEILRHLLQRNAPWYSESLGPLLLSLAGAEMSQWFFLSVRNESYSPHFAEDDILEIPHFVKGREIIPLKSTMHPPVGILQETQRRVNFERFACAAVLDYDRLRIKEALLAHPWCASKAVSDAMVDDVVNISFQ